MTQVIAEVGMAHDGSLGMAHSYIDAIAMAGADAVKFQCHIADEEALPTEEWRVKPDWPQDESRYDYWKRTEFTKDQWWGLKAHAKKKGLQFIVSPFCPAAVRMLDPLVEVWKVGSGDILNEPLMDAIAETGKPAIMSSGMCTWDELDLAWGSRQQEWAGVMQCTSMYPTPPDRVGLCMMEELRNRYGCLVGLSDHSGSVFAGLGAAALGADLLEVHVCFSRDQFGFDVSSSLTVEELGTLVKGVRFLEQALSPVFKDQMAENLADTRELFMGKWRRKAGIA